MSRISNAPAEPYAPTAMMEPSSPSDGGLFGDSPAYEPGDFSELDGAQSSRLHQLETVIQSGLNTFYEVGNALVEVRETRLYRAKHPTFEAYCREKWGMTRQHANRMISAAQVVEELEPSGSKPASEAVARPLARLEPEQRQEAWELAQTKAGGNAVTGAHVEAAASEIAPRAPATAKAPASFDDTAVVREAPDPDPDSDPEEYEDAETETDEEFEDENVLADAAPAPAPKPKAAPAPAPTAATTAPTIPKAPEGFISTFVPRDDCFFLQDEGFSMQEIFGTMRRFVELGQSRGLAPDDLLTTLRAALGLDAEETETEEVPDGE